MNSNTWLHAGVKRLAAAGITTARLDCLVLLEDVLNTNRTQILAHPARELTDENITILSIALEKRTQHIPLAYIRGKSEFYGREFIVDERVLEPRPESETMIDILKHAAADLPGPHIVDVGTGSGALAITAKIELPRAVVTAIDIDPDCLRVARSNARKHHVHISLVKGSLLEPLANDEAAEQAILLCNLPYVPDSFQINTAALHEPRLAIFGGPDGLDLYRQLFAQAAALPHRPHYILTEAMPPQHPELTAIADSHGYRLETRDDFIQLFIPATAR